MQDRICMVIDIDRCWGCQACELACKQELELDVGPRPLRVIDVGPRTIDTQLHKDSIPTFCQHCDEPACLAACPSDAIYREADGSVQIDSTLCSGCGACEPACPFGAIEIIAGDVARAVKCTLCFTRRQEGGIPSCAQHCPGRAYTLTNEQYLNTIIDKRFFWRTGRIVYVSSKWSTLGGSFPKLF